ncbi:MAG: FtsX-like permease family protein [Proteobacteria bacterium]|nr:FtsX-like permease family protein [Pseudomonadota bacterium]
MTIAEASTAPRVGRPRGRLAALALAEIARSGRGFSILVLCIALGVAVITGVGSLSDAMRASFEAQGQTLLGGDVTLARPHRRATVEERRWLDAQGRVSESATLRSMARLPDGSDQALVEVKGVDRAYPLVGTLQVGTGEPATAKMFAERGAIVDPVLLERLGVKVGDTLQLGRSQIRIAATLNSEPDKISDRFTVGPRVFVSLETLEGSGLADPGGLVRWRYAILLGAGSDRPALKTFRMAANAAMPEAGFAFNDRLNPSPSVTRTLDQLRQFLTLIGLASLMIGGVGVANAVKAYVDRRRKAIAAMKSLGASRRQIFEMHLVQVMALAAAGTVLGLGVGLLVPLVGGKALSGVLPVPLDFRVSLTTLALAAAYGVLVALLFSLWPLGRAGEIRAASLFREDVDQGRDWPPLPIVIASVLTAAVLAALAIATSEAHMMAVYFLAGVGASFGVFSLLGAGIAWTARRVPRPRRPELSLALGTLGGPGGLTRSVVLSLGAGLSLLTGVALVDASIVDELQRRLPANSPDYFLMDVPQAEWTGLSQTISKTVDGARLFEAPMLRGRIVALNGIPADKVKATPDAQWVLRGDRGLSYAAEIPEGSRLVAGRWWPRDYNGPPLVSFEAELARLLKLKVGDTITVNVLGRNLTAEITSLREVHWESLGINFVLVFSPNVLKAAPHNLLATISLPPGTPIAEEVRLARLIGKEHPSITVIRVKDAIDAFNAVFRKIMTAIGVAGGVTLLAGGLVLAGALTTAQRQRVRLAVILKAIGATRRQIVAAHLTEYLILAAATAIVAIGVSALGAYAVLRWLMKVEFTFSISAIAQSVGIAIGLVVTLGLFGTLRVLAARPVPYLRGE